MTLSSTVLPENIVRCMSDEDKARFKVKTVAEQIEHARNASEAEIQEKVERYLQYLGFQPRTPKAIKAGKPRAGWYVHLHKCKENPLILDLLILHNEGLFFELELKRNNGKWSSEPQRMLVEYGGSVAYSAEQSVSHINTWLIENGLMRDGN